ncbi:putative ubiquitin c-terminal hydrolase [Phaeomoniella chlamydospora]|uniref:Ubiquitin carboxyl-terminal hydrolase n=1 Tax=Phaeomoniella chlamydospora TaxID=158046 RepID=A0A0G2DU17_PHACM|nr:putative ubiquitin c-terminal hydrolase [Phaeomoniella chlamydospora]
MRRTTTVKANERKVFVPLENNPEVMTSLAHTLGLSKDYAFHDIYTLDVASLTTEMVRRPVLALLFIFPLTAVNETFYLEEESKLPKYERSGPSEPVLWFHQTIGNACGLIGLLHCLTNGPVTSKINPDSAVDRIIKDATPLDPENRSKLLEDSTILEVAHAQHAARGDTAPPPDPRTWHDDQGFIAFVKGNDGHLWELEGRRKGPVDRGPIEVDDMFSETVLEKSVRPFIERETKEGAGPKSVMFSLLGLSTAAR